MQKCAASSKAIALGVLFGKSAFAISKELSISEQQADGLLALHYEVFSVFWEWVDTSLVNAGSEGYVETVLGRRRLVPNGKGMGYMERQELRRSLQNFPTQSNGGEMVRLAIMLATEDGLLVSATVHDACVLLAPLTELAEATRRMRAFMDEASGVILNGHVIPIGEKFVRYPRPLHFGP